ncbi:MAG: class I SAM-dependent methyltransferase [Pseudomonadales bacterium]|nr:class I SAM-dependent methyltransferase [Pseudomonadales bacterium]
MEDSLKLLIDLHKRAKRQGPGGDNEITKILGLAQLTQDKQLNIVDIGCGTGSASIVLAKQLNAQITAVDFLPEFIQVLKDKAEKEGLSEKIDTLVCSMEDLPFSREEYDLIWSEGAIYNMGFEKGVNEWKQFLKPDGLLIVSEITWLTKERPYEIQKYWDSEYPEIDTASAKIGVLENAGYSPISYYYLPEYCWLDNYYRPMQKRFSGLLERHENSQGAQAVVEAEKKEIDLYERYKEYFSYGVYIAKKVL